METNSYDFSSKSCHGSILFVCGTVTGSNFESSKSGAVSFCARCGLKRQLRLMEKIIRPVPLADAAKVSGRSENPASATEPALTKSLRFMIPFQSEIVSGPVFQKEKRIATERRW